MRPVSTSRHCSLHDAPPPDISSLSLHDALPIYSSFLSSSSWGPSLFSVCTNPCTVVTDVRSSCAASVMKLVISSFARRSEEHTSELHSRQYLVCRLLLE